MRKGPVSGGTGAKEGLKTQELHLFTLAEELHSLSEGSVWGEQEVHM